MENQYSRGRKMLGVGKKYTVKGKPWYVPYLMLCLDLRQETLNLTNLKMICEKNDQK